MEILFKNDTGPVRNATAIAGRHVVTSAQATANAAAIDLSSDIAAVEGAVFNILRSGNDVTSDADLTFSGSTLTFADGSTYNATAGDVINYIAFGSKTN